MNDKSLRVLHLTMGSDAGGLSKYIHELSLAMVEGGHEVRVTGDRGAWHWLFEGTREQVPWIETPMRGGPVALARAAVMLRKQLRQWPVDVLHCHYRRPTLVSRALQSLGVKARGGGRLPVLYTLHLSDLSLGWGRRWVSDFGDHTHVASSEAMAWATGPARVPEARVSLIPHGVRPERWKVTTSEARRAARRTLHLGDQDRVAVYVGRLDQNHPKNCPWLLDLAGAWRGRVPLRVLLAGEGPDAPELQARIDREGLSDSVRLLGHRDPHDVYAAADLLLLPSGREGFSLVCAEAMSTGLPVCRTRTAGTHETVVEGVTGVSTPVERQAFLSAALDLLNDEERLLAMRTPAAAHVRDHLTFERQLRETIALYRRLSGV